jgi:plasmid stabilization system protein ParE
MKNGYKLVWTNHALSELAETLNYLELNWSVKDLKKFSSDLNKILEIISRSPEVFQKSDIKMGVHRAQIGKLNTLYYRFAENTIEILSIFSNRKSPAKIKV